ncbi:hypothetical protein J6590_076925 [Homalodisca vitripennis]|nr:hypothetical protein J6590_076925 [Homalodisca vitripennis]
MWTLTDAGDWTGIYLLVQMKRRGKVPHKWKCCYQDRRRGVWQIHMKLLTILRNFNSVDWKSRPHIFKK